MLSAVFPFTLSGVRCLLIHILLIAIMDMVISILYSPMVTLQESWIFVLSPGGGLNRRPVLFAYDPRGTFPGQIFQAAPGPADHAGLFKLCLYCAVFFR